MKKKKLNKIPKFKNLDDEASFWDSHSFVDFENSLKDVEIVVELNKPRTETLVLRIQKTIKDRMEEIADKQGVTLSTLARIWLAKGVRATQ